MSNVRTVLVPTDFGAAAEIALEQATEIASLVGATVVLLHVFEVPTIGFPDATLTIEAELGRRIIEAAQDGLAALVAKPRKFPGVPVRTCIEEGIPWRVIVDVAQRESAGLIVMGTHGRTGLPLALLGSVAEKVVRTAPMPVLVAHKKREEHEANEEHRDRGKKVEPVAARGA